MLRKNHRRAGEAAAAEAPFKEQTLHCARVEEKHAPPPIIPGISVRGKPPPRGRADLLKFCSGSDPRLPKKPKKPKITREPFSEVKKLV